MEIPPSMPRRGFQVLTASSPPPGTDISTSKSGAILLALAISSTTSRINARGTGLIAGSPGASGRPGLVMVPTPSPAQNVMPVSGAADRTVEMISAPWVTSGSSPASLTMPARAQPSPVSSSARANAGCSPFGKVIVTGSGKRPVSSAVSAARVAAVAHAPVVHPLRSAREPGF